MNYLNVDEVESALVALANQHPSLCELITLPHKTFEGGVDGTGRTVHALRIGTRGPHEQDGVLFTGCVHAREWGGADICVYFAADLVEAFTHNAGLKYGGKTFTAGEIQNIVKSRNIFVFPVVNPDGRAYSQKGARWWRRNRRPASPVDINRNHDFMWDIGRYFASGVPKSVGSDNPAIDEYHGSSPASEPETRNIDWLFDTYPRISWYMDIHCYAQELVYSWGMDTNQTHNLAMNFRNPAFDRRRGLDKDAYEEYIPYSDLEDLKQKAAQVRSSIQSVRSTEYLTRQGFYMLVDEQHTVPYPTAGAGDDYAYSRHFSNPVHGKVYGFTLEYSPKYWNPGIENPFNPDWSIMEDTVKDVNAGMIEFCRPMLPRVIPPPRGKKRPLFPWEIWGPFGLGVLAVILINRLVREISVRLQNPGRR